MGVQKVCTRFKNTSVSANNTQHIASCCRWNDHQPFMLEEFNDYDVLRYVGVGAAAIDDGEMNLNGLAIGSDEWAMNISYEELRSVRRDECRSDISYTANRNSSENEVGKHEKDGQWIVE